MCVYSAIHDYGGQQPDNWWNRKNLDEFNRLLDQARRFDQQTGQPACEDPKKIEFLKRIEKRVAAREQADKLFGAGLITDANAFVLGAEWQMEQS